ncbi:MAG: hypothetical protein IPH86_12785 [bacterium]|nr:hypothetical protein [bacterium]
MRQSFLEYHDKPILAPLVREISWAKNRVIIGRGKEKTVVELHCAPRRARSGWRPTRSCRTCRRTTLNAPQMSRTREHLRRRKWSRIKRSTKPDRWNARWHQAEDPSTRDR